jgi:hypothetical protein
MAANHRTARGVPIDMDRIRLANETTIAVGNMKVNARGDQLGAGGKIIKTRQQIMAEKNKLHKGPIAEDFTAVAESLDDVVEFDVVQETITIDIPEPQTVTPTAEDTPVMDSTDSVPGYVKPRGSFADAVAKETEVTQELLDPSILPGSKPKGVQRI